jgi:murein L,D-transpeptidase YafK
LKLLTASLFVIGAGICVLLAVNLRTGASAAGRPGGADPSNDPKQDRGGTTVNRVPLKLPLIDPRIIISKSKRELTLYSGGKIVRVYRVGLGFNPKDDKRSQGDGCTPEGDFYICSRNPKSSYYLSLGLSYPNAEDAERGLRDGLITKAQRDQIVRAIKARGVPPWDTRLGGEVFIHGDGSERDWTLGCVALDNPDMKELFDVIEKGTPVTIRP